MVTPAAWHARRSLGLCGLPTWHVTCGVRVQVCKDHEATQKLLVAAVEDVRVGQDRAEALTKVTKVKEAMEAQEKVGAGGCCPQ